TRRSPSARPRFRDSKNGGARLGRPPFFLPAAPSDRGPASSNENRGCPPGLGPLTTNGQPAGSRCPEREVSMRKIAVLLLFAVGCSSASSGAGEGPPDGTGGSSSIGGATGTGWAVAGTGGQTGGTGGQDRGGA